MIAVSVTTDNVRLIEWLLEKKECDWVEFKVNWFDPHAVGRYASALANSAALEQVKSGYLLWGVSDNGKVVGTKINPVDEKVGEHPFEFWLKGRLTKGHDVRFFEVRHKAQMIRVMEVAAARTVSVRFDHIAYIRIGQTTPPLEDHPDRERRLMEILVQKPFEDEWAMERATDDEVFELVDVSAAVQAMLTSQQVPKDRSELLRLLSTSGNAITKVGDGFWSIPNRTAILFANRLERFGSRFERRAPRVTFYAGDDRTAPIREQVGVNGYALALEGLFEWLEGFLPRSEQISGAVRRDVPLYPPEALRELVANAVIHQDFAIVGSGPMVEVFNDRIEISNPGTPLVDLDRLIDSQPQSRNERLALLMRRMGFCEERGSGIDKVILQTEVFQLPPPAFENKTNGFVATMFAPRGFAKMTREERIRACYQHACLSWVSGSKRITNSSLRERFGLTGRHTSQMSRLISEALDAGVIRMNPNSRSRSNASYQPYWA